MGVRSATINGRTRYDGQGRVLRMYIKLWVTGPTPDLAATLPRSVLRLPLPSAALGTCHNCWKCGWQIHHVQETDVHSVQFFTPGIFFGGLFFGEGNPHLQQSVQQVRLVRVSYLAVLSRDCKECAFGLVLNRFRVYSDRLILR